MISWVFVHDSFMLMDEDLIAVVFHIFCAVMLMGTLVYGIRYTFPEYLCTILVAGGVSSFALSKVSI